MGSEKDRVRKALITIYAKTYQKADTAKKVEKTIIILILQNNLYLCTDNRYLYYYDRNNLRELKQ